MPALMKADRGFLFEHRHLAPVETLAQAPGGCQTYDPAPDDYDALAHFGIKETSRRRNRLRMHQPDEFDAGAQDESLLHHSVDHLRLHFDQTVSDHIFVQIDGDFFGRTLRKLGSNSIQRRISHTPHHTARYPKTTLPTRFARPTQRLPSSMASKLSQANAENVV